MARVMDTPGQFSKRPSPEEDSDEEDAQRRVIVKREKRDHASSSRQEIGTPAGTQDTNMTSQSDEEEEDEDDEDEMEEDEEDTRLDDMDDATAREHYEVAYSRKAKYAGQVREAGIIKSVTLTDFMCHRHLTADFGEKMNFLVGHNGSGKSAILTAISIAFGGRAAQTGRGSSLKDLVMKGADKATISITLENKGTGAFEPETYNPYLVIERVINLNGATQYRFRSSKDGKVLANKRETLTRIVDRFGLHIDSPLTVLTQDQARSFLQSSDPKSLYSFFLQGTLLASLSTSYNNIQQQIKFFEKLKQSEEEGIPELKEENDRWLRKSREIQMVLNKRRDLDVLTAELAWAYAIKGERELREAEAEAASADGNILRSRQRLEVEQAKLARCETKLSELDKTIKDFDSNEAPVKAQRETQRKKVAAIQKMISEMSSDIKRCEQAIELGRHEVEDYESRIKKKESASKGENPEVARLRDAIQKHQTLIGNLRRMKPKLEQMITDAEVALAKAQAEEKTATDIRLDATSAATAMSTRIDGLKAQSSSRLNAFGHRIDLVMREIDKARWTAGRPLGPLGMHVKLKDPRYKEVFHAVMGQTLCTWAVLNDRDRNTMRDILLRCQRQGYKPGFATNHRGASSIAVIQHTGDRFDFSKGDLSNINDTILSKLDIDNEDVRNILVDKHHIESTFIWPQISGPMGVTDRVRALYRDGIRNCNFITADMFNARGNNGRDSSGPINQYTGLPLLTTDVARDIEESRHEHGQLIRKRDESIQVLELANAETHRCRAALANAKRELDKVTDGLKKSEKKERELADQLSEIEQVDVGANLAELHNGAEARKRGEEEQLAQLQSELEDNQKIERDAKRMLKEIETELEALAPQRTETIEATTLLAQDRSQAINDAEWWKKKIVISEQIYGEKRKTVEVKEGLLQGWLSAANSMSKNIRVETDRSVKELDRLVKAASDACTRAQEETGVSHHDIARQVIISGEKLKAASTTVIEMTRLLEMFKTVLDNRRDYWSHELKRSSIFANSSFISSMEKRRMDATIMFDHEKLGMYIRVKQAGSQSQADASGQVDMRQEHYKTPKTMSGGERSFTTVSLLLAMWELSSSPMRCLDEWDVFLDPANRGVAAKMLLDGAKRLPDTQFILITPQAMGGIDIRGEGNKIIRLADPDRNQRTLNFQAQAQTQTQTQG